MAYIIILIPILFGISHLIGTYKPCVDERLKGFDCAYYRFTKINTSRIFNPAIAFYKFDEAFRFLIIQSGFDGLDICIIICNIQLIVGSKPI
jgi:hypothetical protein